jgi:hypothetical protein
MPFFLDGSCEDPAYKNTRDHPRGADDKHFVEQLWARFYPLADHHFREDARNHFLQRFWEMYLAVTLLEHGFVLHRQGDEGPEFYATLQDHRIWFEAVAPGPGMGSDRVPDIMPGASGYVPTEKVLLRYTNALDEKRKKYADALKKNIVSLEDAYVLAINCRGIPHAWVSGSMPYFIQAFLPFGPYTLSVDTTTLEILDAHYQYRAQVSKISGSPVSTRTFLDEEATFCSALLHSGVDCANHPNRLGEDFSILHNPRARRRIPHDLFSWCWQFTLKDDELHRSAPVAPHE